MRNAFKRRVVTALVTAAMATAGVAVITATPASAACTATIAEPYITVVNGVLHAKSHGYTSGCGTGPWEVMLFRSRWFGDENMGRSGRWSGDGSRSFSANCAGTHDWKALLQKNGVNYKWSTTATISC